MEDYQKPATQEDPDDYQELVKLLGGLLPEDYPEAVLLDGSREMTGDLVISKSSPKLTLEDGANFSELYFDDVENSITIITSLHVWGDYLVDDTEQGPVLIDRVTGLKRRILSSSGVLSTEAA